MAHRCPWYLGYFLINPFRRLVQNPQKLLAPHVRSGFEVLEPGPGMGYFTLDLARLVGPAGKVHVVDIEPRMLSSLVHRAQKAGCDAQIDTRLAHDGSLGIDDLAGRIDFVLAFAVVHELDDAGDFFAEAAAAMKPGARLLFAEPRGHVSEALFADECRLAMAAGLTFVDRPAVWQSHAAIFAKA